jgi:hypothetical protein
MSLGQASLSMSSSSMLSMMVLVLLTAHMQQASALYHTSSEVLHWFSHWAAKRPDVLRCACSGLAVAGCKLLNTLLEAGAREITA